MHAFTSNHLAIEGIALELILGSSEEERKKPQKVEIDIICFFPRMPLGCATDEKKDVLSYEKCIEIARNTALKKEFQLIEHLAYEIHTSLKKELPMHIEIMVKVKKLYPLPDITKGVSFTYFPMKDQPERKKTPGWADD